MAIKLWHSWIAIHRSLCLCKIIDEKFCKASETKLIIKLFTMRDGQKDNRRWKNRSITDMTNTTHICLNGAYKVDTMKLFYASYMQIVEFCNPEYGNPKCKSTQYDSMEIKMCIVSVIHMFVNSYQRKFSILKLFTCLSLQLPCLAINLRGSTRKSLNITESG